MHGYKTVGPHSYPGVRFENAGKRREHFWSRRQQFADQVCVNKLMSDWKLEAMRLPNDKKQMERRLEL